MKLLLLILFAGTLAAQTCSHTLTRTPNGPLLVYREGKLLTQGTDYSSVIASGTMPMITPLAWSDGDKMSAVFSRAVPLGFTFQGQAVSYWGYQLWREDWVCVGSAGLPSGALVLGGSISGGFGFAASDTAQSTILLLAPVGDGSGKYLQDAGPVPCPTLDPRVMALNPVCHQAVWAIR